MMQAEPAATLEELGWTQLIEIGYPGLIGPFWERPHEEGIQYGIQTTETHLNRNGVVHGGLVLALADQALGYTAINLIGGPRMATIQLDVQFLSPVMAGDFVIATGCVTRDTRSVTFVRGEVRVGSTLVATATGVWKKLRISAAPHVSA